MIDVTPGRRITGNLEVDNAGNPYTGVYQGGGTITLNEPFGIGDAASVRVLTSGTGLQYVRGSYQAQWRDVSLGASYTYFHYRLGRQFSALHADGSEQIASVYAGYPLIRSYDNNLQLLVSAEYRTFTDNIDAIRAVTDRRAEVVTIGLNGDHHDTFGGGGWDAYSLYLTGGNLDLQTRLARDVDAATARTDGGYGKLRFSLDRLQRVQGPFSLYASIRGQVAFKNLDISEKMELGGAYAVRAYPEGEAYGDEGYVATAEGRVRLPKPTWLPGQLQFAGFYDAGWVRYVKTPWFTGSNSATRSGAGVGLTWVNDNKFQASASYAFRLSRPATSSPGGDGQFWFQLVKFF
jgi:hemolysin activation/secretion protein